MLYNIYVKGFLSLNNRAFDSALLVKIHELMQWRMYTQLLVFEVLLLFYSFNAVFDKTKKIAIFLQTNQYFQSLKSNINIF